MAKHYYEVIVTNVGTVYTGANKAQALKSFGIYRAQSKITGLRASGEDIVVYCDGDVIAEYIGSLSKDNT